MPYRPSWQVQMRNELFLIFRIAFPGLFAACLVLAACSSDVIPPGGKAVTPEISVWLSTADQAFLLKSVDGLVFRTDLSGGDYTVSVDDQVQYQQMDGFGASMTESSAYVISNNLTQAERDNLMTKFFDRSQGIGISLLRQPMGASDFSFSNWTYDDMPTGNTDVNLTNFSIGKDSNAVIPLIKIAMSINSDLRIMASPWSPPGWMRTGDKMVQGGTLKTNYYAAYSGYFVKFITRYASAGIPVFAVTVQNETEYEPLSNAGMLMSATEEANFIKKNLGMAFATNGITTKILCYDHNWDNTNHAATVLGDTIARAYIAGTAWHSYGGTPDAMTVIYNQFSAYGKGIWFTEGGSGTWVGGNGSWKSCFKEQVQYLISITRNWSRSVIWWNLALNQYGGPIVYTNTNNYGLVRVDTNSRTVDVPYQAGYYSLGHLSKFVRPGAYRISSSSDTNSLQSVAFKNADGKIALLVYNQASGQKTVRVSWRTKGFLLAMPAESAVTFYWDGN